MCLAFSSGTACAQDLFEVNIHATALRLPELGETPVGIGGGFSYTALFPFLSIDSELDSFPTNPSGNFGATEGFFGLRAGARVRKLGLFVKARPGFIHFSGGADEGRLSPRTQFALDLGGGFEYDLLPHIGTRVDLGETIIPFGNATLTSGPGIVGVPLGTQHNFQASIGLVVHF